MESGNGKLYELLNELAKSGVRFITCGGVACIIHGVERTTHDLDIAIDFSDENIRKILEVVNKFDLIPRIPEPVENLFSIEKRNDWVSNKGALVYTFVSPNTALQLDIFLTYPISFDELEKNSILVTIDNFDFLISSIEDLLFIKNNISPIRDKDKTDINELERILREKHQPGNR